MKMKKLMLALLVLLVISSITACDTTPKAALNTTETTEGSIFPMTIRDSYDREVKIEKEPQRIVALAPNITEIMFALGREDQLVGRTDYCDYPSEVSKIASIGSLQTPSIEKIATLKPDLVIASTHFSKDTLKKLEELKIPTVVLYGDEDFEGVYETISKAGKILNAEKNAEIIIGDMKKKVDTVTKNVEGKDKPSVYYVIGYGKSGDYTAGKNTFIGQLIKMAGAKNVADDVDEWKYSLEKLIEKNPDIMICSLDGGVKQGLESTNGYKDLKAVEGGKLYAFNTNLIDRQGPRLADGLVELAKIIHPEALK